MQSICLDHPAAESARQTSAPGKVSQSIDQLASVLFVSHLSPLPFFASASVHLVHSPIFLRRNLPSRLFPVVLFAVVVPLKHGSFARHEPVIILVIGSVAQYLTC